MKKNVFVLLLAGLLAMQTVSCGGTETETDLTADTAAGEMESVEVETEPETTPLEALGTADMGGMTFHIMDANDYWDMHVNIHSGEQTGEPINDAVYERDALVAENYNTVITYQQELAGNGNTAFKNSVTAGDNNYNLIYTIALGSGLSSLTSAGMLYDLNSISSGDDAYWGNTWWSPLMYDTMQLNGKFYYTTGDIAACVYQAPSCVFYNATMGLDYDQNVEDLYNMVLEGKWTYDVLGTMSEGLNEDLNGDNMYAQEDDFAGIIIQQKDKDCTNGLLVSCGISMSALDESGTLTVDLMNDKTVSAIEMLNDLLYSPAYTHETTKASTHYMFPEGRGLFLVHKVETATAALRDMEDDFAILPMPKYDEAQDSYYSLISGWVHCFVGMPKTLTDPESNGFITEALARAAYQLVRPAAYETTLKGKAARDEQSSQMLDLIFNSLYMDFNCLYDFGGVCSKISTWLIEGEGFSSGYAALENPIQAAIEKVAEAYSE
ncbi:MAG: hypothetical protein IJ480_10135 [Clostridia bacterium]|nr:hypothetical protein [Clostridia bacterium]